MDNHALGASSTTIGLPFFLSSLTYVESDTSVRDARLLFHVEKLACDLKTTWSSSFTCFMDDHCPRTYTVFSSLLQPLSFFSPD